MNQARRRPLKILCWCLYGLVGLALLLTDVGLRSAPASGAGKTAATTAPTGIISLGQAAIAAAAPPHRGAKEEEASGTTARLDRILQVGKGDTLMQMMVDAGVDAAGAHAAISALRGVYDPRHLRPGQKVTLTFEPDPDQPGADVPDATELVGMTVASGLDADIKVERTPDDSYVAMEVKRPLTRRLTHKQGVIHDSLFDAATRVGVPPSVLHSLIRVYSWDVDFQRDIHPGDRFEVMYERYLNDEGKLVRDGSIVFAALTLGDESYPVYRFTDAHGRTDYFDERGHSVRRSLLRTPIDGARLSSRYGKRRHPILGYSRMHRGVDFAAPPGTPIYAAGDGKIVVIGRNGGYGKYIRIRHNAEYSTAYAHMRRFAKGLHRGSRVKQGQTIGYVGTTGLTTGPHLHYEFLRKRHQVNPMKEKMPAGRRLKGKELEHFQSAKVEIDVVYAALASAATVARGE